jgi:hypothetical protein
LMTISRSPILRLICSSAVIAPLLGTLHGHSSTWSPTSAGTLPHTPDTRGALRAFDWPKASRVSRLADGPRASHLATTPYSQKIQTIAKPGVIRRQRSLRGCPPLPYGQNNYRTLGASDIRRVAASPLLFFMKNRLIIFERATGANARLSNRARQ